MQWGTTAAHGAMEGDAMAAPLHSPGGSFPSALFSLQQAGSVSEESDPAHWGAPGGQELPEKAAVPAPIVFQVLVALSVTPTPACVCQGCCDLHSLAVAEITLPSQDCPRGLQTGRVRKFMCASNKKQLSLLLNV